MKWDLDKEDSELLTPLFRWGFFICSVVSFCIGLMLSSKGLEEYDHWFLLMSVIMLLVSLHYSKDKQSEKEEE